MSDKYVLKANSDWDSQVVGLRWLTKDQSEMKARLQVNGKVACLYESANTVNEETYIPEHSKVNLTQDQALRLFTQLTVRIAPKLYAQKLLKETKYHGPDVEVYIWGLVHKEKVYLIRIAKEQDNKIGQIWCGVEEASDLRADTDPVVQYLTSLAQSNA